MMVYDYVGNFIFTVVFAVLFQILVDKPFGAMFSIQEDYELSMKKFPNAVPTGMKVGGGNDSQETPLIRSTSNVGNEE